MAIHHAIVKQAEKYGFTIEEKGDLVRTFMPKTSQQLFGVSAKDAMNQMLAFQNILNRDENIRAFHVEGTPQTHVRLRRLDDGTVSELVSTPVEQYRSLKEVKWVDKHVFDTPIETGETADTIEDTLEMHSPSAGEPGYREPVGNEPTTGASSGTTPDFAEDPHPKDPPLNATAVIKRNEKGIPLDGATAYKEGIMAADNPFEEGSDEGDAWDTQWDQAADEAPEDSGREGGSVVSSRYRTKYKEAGHPNHCGDWLAELLNNFCIGDKNTDLAMLERICGLNGVDTSKYKREGNGWQGRIRMTGRNLLARKVFSAGKVIVPALGDVNTNDAETGEHIEPVQEIVAPADWIAAQRYTKPKAE